MKRSDPKYRKRLTRQLVKKGAGTTSEGCFEYNVFIDRRIKNIRLTWRPGSKLTISLPWRVNPEESSRLLNEHHTWITTCQAKHRTLLDHPQMPSLTIGGRLLFRGRSMPIVVSPNGSSLSDFVLDPDQLVVPDFLKNDSNPEDSIVKWLKDQAKEILIPHIIETASEMNISIKKYAIRDQSTRWASWSSRNHISLNWRLIMAPPEVFHYIAVHELTHALHPDHSKQFWTAVAERCPDWKERRAWLKQHQSLLWAFR
ncbi:MAG: SprT family zinc-dependent metalloprotease [bacterium]